MTTETDRDIAKREPQKGVNGSNGTQAGRFALHELPIPGAADSLQEGIDNRVSSPADSSLSQASGEVRRRGARPQASAARRKLLPVERHIPDDPPGVARMALPYVGSRVKPGDFHPCRRWKCNLDCHYCWANDNRPGMTEASALYRQRRGPPPQFVHKVADYAVQKGCRRSE